MVVGKMPTAKNAKGYAVRVEAYSRASCPGASSLNVGGARGT
jgi:hypothetical protein